MSRMRASERAAMVACSTTRTKAGLAPIIFVLAGGASDQLAQAFVFAAGG